MLIALLAAYGCTSVGPADAGNDASDPGQDAGPGDAGPGDAGVIQDAGRSRERCDEEGEVCCSDGMCGGGLPCTGGICGYIGCGDLGSPCCGPGGNCYPWTGTVCEDGLCVEPHCGSENFECCTDGATAPCREDFVCHEGTCLRCGDLGEQCCPGHECDGDYYCLVEGIGLGQCLAEAPPCGGNGERCCPEGEASAPCDAGLGCQGNWCAPGPACGAEGRLCCETDPACGAGFICAPDFDSVERCQRCGDFNLPCCDGATPCGPGLMCSGESNVCTLPPPPA